MKFTMTWLKEHLDTKIANEDIVNKLTSIGLEVEEISDTSKVFSDFIVAQVMDEKKHPDADKLKVCKVDTGSKIIDVVCGAPNVEKNMKVVYAPPGAVIPSSQMKLKTTKIRGVESLGMLCSEHELGISENHDGIIKLDDNVKVGQPYAEISGLDDVMVEIGITPNRQDCLGVYGIARDLSAAGLGKLKFEKIDETKSNFKSPIAIEIQDLEKCPAFAGRYIKNLKNIESPEWLKKRIKSIGLRPISALVDITNFIMFDINRPLHVYDADKVKSKIIVRASKKGETFQGLDEKKYDLDDGMCVIADTEKVLGLGGIMGGEESGCTPATNNVFLESALFNPISTAKSGRKLSIDSDARYRFERGVDSASVIMGINKASKLILEICGGEASDILIAGNIPNDKHSITLNCDRVYKRLGINIDQKEIVKILNDLGIKTSEINKEILCEIPSWRQDIHEEADLTEEIIRIKGYDCIPTLNIRSAEKVNKFILNESQKRVSRIKRFLASRSYNELVTWSFTSSEDSIFYGDISKLKIVNPISEDLDILRSNLLPNIVGAVKKNILRGFDSFSFFEVGNQFISSESGGQKSIACGVRSGIKQPNNWRDQESHYDIFDIKNDFMDLLNHILPQKNKLTILNEAPDWYHPGRSGTLLLNKTIKVGYFGELHPRISSHFKIKNRINAFELLLDDIPFAKKKSTNKPNFGVSKFQKVFRDFAFILDSNIRGEELIFAALKVDQNIIKDVDIFDIFEDSSLGINKKSMAIKVTMQADDRTLSESEIQDLSSKIIIAIETSTSGSVRS